jgi:hypothetical protein
MRPLQIALPRDASHASPLSCSWLLGNGVLGGRIAVCNVESRTVGAELGVPIRRKQHRELASESVAVACLLRPLAGDGFITIPQDSGWEAAETYLFGSGGPDLANMFDSWRYW